MSQISVPIRLDHIFKMTSKIGFYQFAKESKPDLKFGYSLDDQARALILTTQLYKLNPDPKLRKLMLTYFNYIERVQLASGFFHNFVDQDGKFRDKIGSLDSFGRTIWALGFIIWAKVPELKKKAEKIFKKAAKQIKIFNHLRPRAFSLLGLCYYVNSRPNRRYEILIGQLSASLMEDFKKNSDKDWQWFEKKLIYSNAIIPYALLYSYKVSKKEDYKNIALVSLDFLNKVCREGSLPAPIGFDGWYPKDGRKALFGQQPIDAADMVLANCLAYELIRDKKYYKQAKFWFSWFFGHNLLHKSLYNRKDGGCRDGLFADRINSNQGAESTILFHLANLEIKKLEE